MELQNITGSFNPTTVTGAGASTLTISVTGSAAMIPGAIPLTITGTSGVLSQSTHVKVDVTDIGEIVAPCFSIATGTYSTPQTVIITDPSVTGYNDMFIYYTADGTTPTTGSPCLCQPDYCIVDNNIKGDCNPQ